LHSDFAVVGHLFQVALLAIVSDHPAMCKAAGFADHTHKKWPCTKCNVTRDELYTDQSLANSMCSAQFSFNLTGSLGFAPCNGKDFHQKSYAYHALNSKDAHKKFFDEHSIRWTEFARLSYFNVVRCSVIDPMHNLLKGIVKNQWFSRWIKDLVLCPATDKHQHELSAIHDFMDSVSHSYSYFLNKSTT
jgi:hypothetical protein